MTLPTYDEAFARARQRSAFSNGTEADCWFEANCGTCVHDKPARNGDPGNGCPLIMVAYMDRTPVEWLEQEGIRLGDQYHCVMYRSEDDPGPNEPTPIPDPPDQEVLFPRDGFERPARMFVDTAPQPAEAAS